MTMKEPKKALVLKGQTIRVFERGVVHFVVTGPSNAEETRAALHFIRAETKDEPHVFTIVIFEANEPPDADTRKVVAEESDEKPGGTVIVGGSFTMRTIAKMMVTVVNLAKKKPDPTAFVDTVAEAEEWIGRRRAALTGGAA